AELSSVLRMRKEVPDLVGATLNRVHQHTCELMDDLRGNSSDCACDYRLLLPQCLGNGEAEAFLERFLNNDGGTALQGIYLQGRPGRQVKDDHVGIVTRL